MATDASTLVRNLRNKAEEKPKQQYSEWPRCQANDCVLMSSHKAGGVGLCTYHAAKESYQWPSITLAIKEEKMLVRKLHQMTVAGSNYWTEKRPQMLGWEFFPMEETEPPSSYLMRFSKKVQEVIYDKASELMDR